MTTVILDGVAAPRARISRAPIKCKRLACQGVFLSPGLAPEDRTVRDTGICPHANILQKIGKCSKPARMTKQLKRVCVTVGLFAFATTPLEAHAQSVKLYERGHADVSIVFDAQSDNLDVVWHFDDAIVDGELTNGTLPIADAAAFTSATFQRPESDTSGRFALLGVEPGESTYYIPVDNTTATREGVPFMGWSNDVQRGTLRNNQVKVTLTGLQAAGPFQPQFSLWNISSLTPNFFMSSVDGIDANDRLVLNGHDHFFMNFALSDAPAVITAQFEATAVKVDGTPLKTDFDVLFLTCTPGVDCPEIDESFAAPVLNPALAGLVGLLLGGSVLNRRRRWA